MLCSRTILAVAAIAALLALAPSVRGEEPVTIKFSRAELEAKWQTRIQSFLGRGVIPLIDLQSTLKRGDGESYLEDAIAKMDELGIALIAFDGRKGKRDRGGQRGYRWGYYIHEIVNAYPGHIVLATNGGTNRNWAKGKESFISQLETHVESGVYPIMGEIEFRHYKSNRQCKQGREDRELDKPLDGDHGRRVVELSARTGVAMVIHHDPEDAPLSALENMLKAYPKAKIVVAHFGQIRRPERQSKFGPPLVRRLLASYPNLYYDLSVGAPGRTYKCNGDILDTVIWQNGDFGQQKDVLRPEYKRILTEFSTRFVTGFDYGGGKGSLARFLAGRVANARLIQRDLPEHARHNISYRNAWKLLTGRAWRDAGRAGKSAP